MLRAVASGVSGYNDEIKGPSGSSLKIEADEVELALSGASVSAGDLVPNGALLLGVTTRVTEPITGASGYTIGDGSDVDRWGDVSLTSLGDVTLNAHITDSTVQIFTSSSDIVLTANGSNFTGGKVRVVAFWLRLGAPTE